MPNAGGGDLSLAPGSALAGAGDPAAVQGGELDLGGNARSSACTGTPAAVTNIEAYETATPQCPAPPPTGNSIGGLTQLSGAGNCVTGDTTAASGCGTAQVPGLTGGTATYPSPQDMVVSPDGRNVYTVGEDPSGNGIDVAEFARGAGGLQQLPAPNNCISSGSSAASGCGTGNVTALDYPSAGFTSQPVAEAARLAISPDGKSVYVDAGAVIDEFTRDPVTGALTEMGAGNCIEENNADSSCAYQNQGGIAPPAALVVSPDGKGVYLATLNNCAFAAFRGLGARAQNPNCNNGRPQYFAQADVAVFKRDTATGALAPATPACYANSTYTPGGCTTTGLEGLYGITSLAISPDGRNVYVTSERGANAGSLSADPGEITELQRDPATNALTQMTGAGACVTAGSGCGGADAGTNGAAGLIEPQQIVISPDGVNAYVTSAQYEGGSTGVNTGTLVASTVTQLARDPATGAL
ncbi:MAG TPA: hypothetical protein VMU66_11040 [Gaiellales bacterium]|nr:hypothetical protein [Gaiellales bacterium]